MKAIFLDRDGTLIKETKNGLIDTSQLRLYRRVPEGLKILQENGYKLVIITNQSLIARGLISENRLNSIHKYLKKLLAKKGIKIDAIYYCPHHPTKGIIKRYSKICDCRKPEPGLLKRAIKDFDINPEQSFFIGDSLGDMKAAGSLAVKFILVLTGYGKRTLKELNACPPIVAFVPARHLASQVAGGPARPQEHSWAGGGRRAKQPSFITGNLLKASKFIVFNQN